MLWFKGLIAEICDDVNYMNYGILQSLSWYGEKEMM